MLRIIATRAFSSASRRGLSTFREPGVVGLKEGENPREMLTNLYVETLEAVKAIPESASYRQNVEKITNYRMGIVSENSNIETIEAKLNVGQMVEIIEQAENELELIPHMVDWKPWEMSSGKEPAVITVVD